MEEASSSGLCHGAGWRVNNLTKPITVLMAHYSETLGKVDKAAYKLHETFSEIL
jgi:hypothetical protein